MGITEQPVWNNGPTDGEIQRSLRDIARRPCADGNGRCPRDKTCAPCQAFWLLLYQDRPVTWVVATAHWFVKISS